MKLFTSKAIVVSSTGSTSIAASTITGRRYTMESHVKQVLDFCKAGRSRQEVVNFLKPQMSGADINVLIEALIRNNVLVEDFRDAFKGTRPSHPALWGCGSSKTASTRIAIVGAPFGNGNTEDVRCKDFPQHFRNCALRLLSYKSLLSQLEYLNKDLVGQSFDIDNFKALIKSAAIADLGDTIYYCGEEPKAFYERLHKIAIELFRDNVIPICIGGDHSVSYAIIEALDSMGKPFVVLQFDAHADMNDGIVMQLYEEASEKILNHANVMRRVLELGNVAQVFQIGVREPFVCNSDKTIRISVDELKRHSYQEKIEAANMPVYITFDIDFFDPALAPGTANILPNGGDYDSTFTFLADVLGRTQILGIDVVEANPAIDIRNKTSVLVNNLLMQLISLIRW